LFIGFYGFYRVNMGYTNGVSWWLMIVNDGTWWLMLPCFSQHIPNMFPGPNIFMALNILLIRSQRFPNISPFHGASFAPGLRQWGAPGLWPRSASARLAPGLERWGLFAQETAGKGPIRRLYPW
jgi:hypothetical protein